MTSAATTTDQNPWARMSDGQIELWQREWIRRIVDTRNFQQAGFRKENKGIDIEKRVVYWITNYDMRSHIPAPLRSKTGANDWEAIATILCTATEAEAQTWPVSKHFRDYHHFRSATNPAERERPLPFGTSGYSLANFSHRHIAATYMATFLPLKDQARLSRVCKYPRAMCRAFEPVQPPPAPVKSPYDEERETHSLDHALGIPAYVFLEVPGFGRVHHHHHHH